MSDVTREALRRQVDAIRLGYHNGALLRDPSPQFDDWLRQCSLAMRELLHIADAALSTTPAPDPRIWRVPPDEDGEGGETWQAAFADQSAICNAEHSALATTPAPSLHE